VHFGFHLLCAHLSSASCGCKVDIVTAAQKYQWSVLIAR